MFYNVRINGRWETHLVWLMSFDRRWAYVGDYGLCKLKHLTVDQ